MNCAKVETILEYNGGLEGGKRWKVRFIGAQFMFIASGLNARTFPEWVELADNNHQISLNDDEDETRPSCYIRSDDTHFRMKSSGFGMYKRSEGGYPECVITVRASAASVRPLLRAALGKIKEECPSPSPIKNQNLLYAALMQAARRAVQAKINEECPSQSPIKNLDLLGEDLLRTVLSNAQAKIDERFTFRAPGTTDIITLLARNESVQHLVHAALAKINEDATPPSPESLNDLLCAELINAMNQE